MFCSYGLNNISAGTNTRWINADRFLLGLRRINLFVGGYGSGKSEVAINFAIGLKEWGFKVTVADLDIVNPYFRSREARKVLEGFGIEVLLPPVEIMESDLPIIQPEIVGALKNPEKFLVLDLGGDPVGARVLASISPWVPKDEIDSFFVLNSRRPWTRTVESTKKMIEAITDSCGFPITHLIVNSHLIEETSVAVIEEGIKLAESVSKVAMIPIGFVAIESRFFDITQFANLPYPVLVMERYLLKPWEKDSRLGPARFKI
ncbi:MAG: cobalamin biosynthesis protein CobQ [candidate division WOR-3 bacterium]